MELFFQNLETGSNPEKGNVEIPRATAVEVLNFIAAVHKRKPHVFDELYFHPAQPMSWIAELQAALENNEQADISS